VMTRVSLTHRHAAGHGKLLDLRSLRLGWRNRLQRATGLYQRGDENEPDAHVRATENA